MSMTYTTPRGRSFNSMAGGPGSAAGPRQRTRHTQISIGLLPVTVRIK
ncbi:hypothetical protein M1E17_00620 [Arthrobacter sp. D1-29]